MKYKLYIGILLFVSMLPALANVEIVTQDDVAKMIALQQLQWKKKLQSHDLNTVSIGLKSSRDTVVDEALKVVLLHQLYSALPILEKGVGVSYGYSRIFGKELKAALELGEDIMMPMKKVYQKYSGRNYLPLRSVIQEALVINEVKKVREKLRLSVNLHGFTLTNFEKILISYSQTPDLVAVKKITNEISNTNIAGNREYQLIKVLRTYDYDLVSKQVFLELNNFRNIKQLSGIQSANIKYPNRLYLQYLQLYIPIAKKRNLEELKSAVGAIHTTDEQTKSLIDSIQGAVSSKQN